MKIGIGLPTSFPALTAAEHVAWARHADQAGFSSVAAIDRLAHPTLEPLVALAAVAAATERVRLMTAVLIAPFRINAALLAKQVASLDRLSAGRVELGIGVGVREDDFALSGADPRRRGREMDRMLAVMRDVWCGANAVGPPPVTSGGPPLLFGGGSAAAFARAARAGDGWICGAGGARGFAKGAAKADDAWQAAGRTGRPRLLALAYYALGPDADAVAADYLRDYYSFAPPHAERMLADTPTDEDGVRTLIAEHAAAGCDELLLMPCSPAIDQCERLAALVQ